MLSMAFFAHEKGLRFTYLTKPLPARVALEMEGNYYHATRLGMEHLQVVHTDYKDAVAALGARFPDALLIDQGAAHPAAEEGIRMLAEEIGNFVAVQKLSNPGVLLPSGTGTTALYLAKHLPQTIPVFTTPCAGDATYLKAQWHRLEPALSCYPHILETAQKLHFAKPHPLLLDVWKAICASGIEFDMVYAPKTWLAWLENRTRFTGMQMIYIHTGGVLGNPTQQRRYAHKKLI
jgi:1-aminocyclopropane-1-carboxylate deaminase/D-cysteine desulfhydrase-like pyridoxal-dependent ACC family enzyme